MKVTTKGSRSYKNVSNSESLRSGRWSSKERTTEKLQQSEQKRSSLRSEVEGCSSQSDTSSWWQTQSELCGVPDGISEELPQIEQTELKRNSIVPEIAYEIAKAILSAEGISNTNGNGYSR